MTMTPSQQRPPRGSAFVRAGAVVILPAAFYLYVWLCVEPRLLYHQQNPIFVATSRFFRESLNHPGGLLEYVSAFLMQGYSYPWAGAALITLIAGLICLATHGVLSRTAGRRVHPLVSLVPLVLLAMLHGRYRHTLFTSLAILTALLSAYLYIRMALRGALPRLGVFLVLSAVLYYAVGGMMVLHAVLCGVFELVRARRPVLGVLCLAGAAVVPLGFAVFSFDVVAVRAVLPLVPTREGVLASPKTLFSAPVALHGLLVLFFPAAAALVGLRRRAPGETLPRALTAAALFLVASVFMVWLTFDDDVKRQLQVDYFAEHDQWERVLERARGLPPRLYDVYVMHDVNLALYHTGRLLDDMFSYPQGGVPGLQLTVAEKTPIGYWKFTRFCLEMGRVNIAQHWGHYLMELSGERPEVLKLLARTNILKGRRRAADTFLGALAKHPLHRTWAEDYRRRLDGDPLMSADNGLQHIRTVMVDRQYGYGGGRVFTYEALLTQPLQTAPSNRMAFEYLMAYYLLARRPEEVIDRTGRLGDFGYTVLPRHWEEAAAVTMNANRGRNVNLHGHRISDGTQRRLGEFTQDLVRYRRARPGDEGPALETLVTKWGDSYFFYGAFGYSEPRRGWRLRKPDAVTGATR